MTTSQIGVNAGQPIRTANPCWFGIGTPIWDNYLETPQTLTMLSNMGVQALRFPGGSVADQSHWVNNSTPSASIIIKSPWQASFKWRPTRTRKR